MESIKLTIAVAIYNIENYLPKCLESLLNQTEKNGYEILLINDGSTDSSRKICEEYIEKGLKAEIIDKENGGISSVRNLSIDLAKGERILFIDGDDYIEKETIEIIFKEMEDYDLLVFGFNWVDKNKSCSDERFKEKEIYDIKNRRLVTLIYSKEINTSLWNKVLKTSLIRENKLFFKDYKISEDFLFLYDYIFKIENCKKINRNLYNYVYRENSLSNIRKLEYYYWYLKVLNYYIENERKKDEIYYKYILEEYVYLIREIRKIKEILNNKEIKHLKNKVEKDLKIRKIIFNNRIKLKMKLRYLKILFLY